MMRRHPVDQTASPQSPDLIGHIRLYVAGSTPSSQRAQKNLHAAIGMIGKMATLPSIEIIDVFEGPKRAIADGVFVTPTLISQTLKERIMMVGDLSDPAALGLTLRNAGGATE